MVTIVFFLAPFAVQNVLLFTSAIQIVKPDISCTSRHISICSSLCMWESHLMTEDFCKILVCKVITDSSPFIFEIERDSATDSPIVAYWLLNPEAFNLYWVRISVLTSLVLDRLFKIIVYFIKCYNA